MKLRMRICAALIAMLMLCTSFESLALEGESYTSSEQQLILSVQSAIQQGAAYMLNPVGSYYPENGLSFGTLQGDWHLPWAGAAWRYRMTYGKNMRIIQARQWQKP